MRYNQFMALTRKVPLSNDYYYHIFSRSIGKYIIFNGVDEYQRFIDLVDLFRFQNFIYKYSEFIALSSSRQLKIRDDLQLNSNCKVEIIAFCLMPTHFHLILKQKVNNGISNYMCRVLDGYSRYFNEKHKRLGPLWAGRFKNVLVSSDDQMLHLTRYIHLNPTSVGLVDDPEKWEFSSYREYVNSIIKHNNLTELDKIISIKPSDYRKFVDDRKSYQRELSRIKKLIIENYSG